MKVENTSPWKTLDLKRILTRVARPLSPEFVPAAVKIITSTKGNYKGVWMRPTASNLVKQRFKKRGCLLIVPKEHLNPNMLAMIAFDAFRHGRNQTRELRALTIRLREYEWAMDPKYVVHKKPPTRKKTRVEVVETTIKKLDRDLKRWTRKSKLAATKIKALNKKRRYYVKQQTKLNGDDQ